MRSVAKASHGALRVRHSQLLFRGGARTPLLPLTPTQFWQATLPNEAILRRYARSAVDTSGSRLRPKPPTTHVWGQLTTRGVDEVQALGRRFGKWVTHRHEEAFRTPGYEGSSELKVKVFSESSRHADFCAKAVVSNVHFRNSEVEQMFSENLAAPIGTGGLKFAPHCDSIQAAADYLEAVLDLKLTDDDRASWRRILDVIECASVFGLLPQDGTTAEFRTQMSRIPRSLAMSYTTEQEPASDLLQPLICNILSPSLQLDRAAEEKLSEQVRIVVLPGFSLLCVAAALNLQAMTIWPPHASSLVVETLSDEYGSTFVRFWDLRDGWELRPSWHQDGPVSLNALLARLEPIIGTLPPK